MVASTIFRIDYEYDRKLDDFLREHGVEEYEVYDGSDEGAGAVPVNLDNNDATNELLWHGPENSLTLLFDDSAIERLKNGASIEDIETSLPHVKIGTFGRSSKIVIADINHDGLDDIVALQMYEYPEGSFQELNVYTTHGDRDFTIDKNYAEQMKRNDVTAVPETERTGIVRVGGGIWLRGDEAVSTELLQISDIEDDLESAPDRFRQNIPERFRVGSIMRETSWAGETTDDRLTQIGLPVRRIKYGSWLQDKSEFAIGSDGEIVDVLDPFKSHNVGGNISYIRSSDGEIFVTVTRKELKLVRRRILEKEGKVIDMDSAGQVFAKMMGMDIDHLIVMPEITGLVHIDQYVTFPKDGKAIILKLPEDHPDHEKLEEAKKTLVQNGFEITAEIEIPDHFLRNARSPFNILMHQDAESGQVRYVIPLDPVMIIDRTHGFLDLQTGELITRQGSISNASEKDDWLRKRRVRNEGRNVQMIYDTENPWDCVEAMKKALISCGVPQENISIMPHNGIGRGSLHCITNVEPRL